MENLDKMAWRSKKGDNIRQSRGGLSNKKPIIDGILVITQRSS